MSEPDPTRPARRYLRPALITIAVVMFSAQAVEVLAAVVGLASGYTIFTGALGAAALAALVAIRHWDIAAEPWGAVTITASAVTLLALPFVSTSLGPGTRTPWAIVLVGVSTALVGLWMWFIPNWRGQPRDDLPEPAPSRFTGPVSFGVIAILILSFLVTAITSALLPPRSGPDERHHYSYVKYMAENPFQFPPRFERIFTDDGDRNHLMHPPLYYQLMSIPYRIIDVDRSLTSVGREADTYGRVSSQAMIPLLRSASLAFVVLHLAGLFLLLGYLVGAGVLRAWAAPVAAACLSLVPAFTFIRGTLNNDALAMAIWPFLALALARYFLEESRPQLYVAVLLTSAAALTKPTLWILVATIAIFVTATVVLRALRAARSDGSRGITRVAAQCWSAVRPSSVRQGLLFGSAVTSVGLVVFYLATMQLRYGSMHPFPSAVYDFEPTGSRTQLPPTTPLEFTSWSLSLLFRSLFGILGQHERIYPSNPGRLVQVIALLALVSLALGAWRLVTKRRRADNRLDRLALFLLIPGLLFIASFLVRGWTDYHTRSHISAQGRYLIGYVDLWVIGTLALAGRTITTARVAASRWAARVLATLVAVALLWLFVDPLYYLARTNTLHNRMRITDRVESAAIQHGLDPIEMAAVSPDRFVAFGADPPVFRMAYANSTIRGPVALGGERCVEVWIYARGDTAWREPARLDVRVVPLGSITGPEVTSTRVSLPPHREVVGATLKHSLTSDEGTLVISHANHGVHASALLQWFWPRARSGVTIYQVYAGPVECQSGS